MLLVLPEFLWRLMLDAFAEQVPTVERVAFVDGYRGGDFGVATTVTFPDAECHPRRYRISASAMAEAGAHFERFGMVRLAQVHTHGDNDLRHSPWDDELAYSQQDGALSIVLPEHAWNRPRPADGIVHVREPDGWRALAHDEATTCVRLVPSTLDFRR